MDVVVTLPRSFGLLRWIAEGDPAGADWSGEEWGWFMGGNPPKRLLKGDRVYVVYKYHLIGYAPLIRIQPTDRGFALVRGGGAVAATIAERINGFQGYRYRWWSRGIEKGFPEWRRLA